MTEMTPADYAAINRGGGMGFGGDGAWWLIVLFLFAMNGGWGNGWGNAGGGGADAYMQRGFDQSAVMNGINGIQSAVNGIGNQLCNSFAQAEIAANSRQMADMNQMFGVQSALQNCCCENRANIADLKYTVATENCADRAAVSDGIRDLLAATQAQTQTILDKMCQDKIDAKNEQIAALQNQLTMANLAASQNAQTAAILANNEAQTAALEQYLAPVPRPAYVVQNPNCCANHTFGCGA